MIEAATQTFTAEAVGLEQGESNFENERKTSNPETDGFDDVEFRWVLDYIMSHVPKNKNSQTMKHHAIKPNKTFKL